MANENRQHRRIEKPITIQFCIADVYPKKWDMSVLDNISAGGVRFSASNDFDLANKILKLQIKIPALAPGLLEIEAIVLDVKLRPNSEYLDIRAKFINLSDLSKEQLSIVEKMIQKQEAKRKN